MVLKNGCAWMSPTTPNLRLGSRSNNWNSDEGKEYSHFDYRNNTKKTLSVPKNIYLDPDSYQLKQALGLLGDPPRVVRGI